MRPGEGGELARLMRAQLFINASSKGIPMVSGVAGSLIGAAGVLWVAGLMVGAGAKLALGLRKH
jgi:hypothetical protein